MSDERVLAAAAALRSFSLDELAACTDEQPAAIADILTAVGPAVVQAEPDDDGESGDRRWQVVDLVELRRLLHAMTEPRATVDSGDPLTGDRIGKNPTDGDRPSADPTGTHLQHAEETLVRCGAEPSAERRRVLVGTAVNHLRQVLAGTLPGRPPWWTVELSGDQLEHDLRRHPDRSTAVRLQLDVAVARLAVGNAAGRTVPTGELIATVDQFRHEVSLVGDQRVHGLVRGFVELVTAHLAPAAAPAVDRLVVALARRRLRAQVRDDLDGAMDALGPLVRTLGSAPDRTPVQGLHQTLGHLPDGRDRAIVYCDLLALLPEQLQWQCRSEPLPGALVEVIAEPACSDRLSHYARALEANLTGSPYASDRALIGVAAHNFEDLARRGAPLDDGVLARGDVTRSELLDLARAEVWPAPVAAPTEVP